MLFGAELITIKLYEMKRKFIITAEMRELEKQVNLGEISYSRMIEILCEKADEYANPELSKENIERPSFWFMTDAHTFIKPRGNNLQEIVDDLHKIAKENKYGMICPVTIFNKKGKELKRVGGACNVDDKGCVNTVEWLSKITKVKCVRLYDGAVN